MISTDHNPSTPLHPLNSFKDLPMSYILRQALFRNCYIILSPLHEEVTEHHDIFIQLHKFLSLKYIQCSILERTQRSTKMLKKSLLLALIHFIMIRAPSSEFVSLSIPSWQILTGHAQPFRGARDLAFCLKVPLDSLLIWASSEGSGETAQMRRLARTFAARIGYKYQIRLTRSIWSMFWSLEACSWPFGLSSYSSFFPNKTFISYPLWNCTTQPKSAEARKHQQNDLCIQWRQISLCICPGWSESSLGEQVIFFWFCCAPAQIWLVFLQDFLFQQQLEVEVSSKCNLDIVQVI